MTNHLSEDQSRLILSKEPPDVVGATATHPGALTVLGGILATFMHRQVLSQGPWIDVIVRGAGAEIIVTLLRARAKGDWTWSRHDVTGLAFREADTIVASAAAPTVKDLDAIPPDRGELEWSNASMCPRESTSPFRIWRRAGRCPVEPPVEDAPHTYDFNRNFLAGETGITKSSRA